MFNNIGETIKGLAVISSILGYILSFAGAIYCWTHDIIFVGIVVLVVGCFFSWTCSALLYGFGELITQTTNIAKGSQRMQMLTVYNNSSKSSEIKKETIDDIKDEIVEDYEYDKLGGVDNIDKVNIPKKNECPCCFNKINVNDKECSYCGYKLK